MYTNASAPVLENNDISKGKRAKNMKVFLIAFCVFLLTFLSIIYLFVTLKSTRDDNGDEIKKVEEYTEDIEEKISDWRTYRNEEYDFEIMYPKEWGFLLLEKKLDFYHRTLDDVFVFESDNPLIEKIYFHEPNGVLASVSFGDEVQSSSDSSEEHVEELYNKEINLFYQDGSEKLVYVAPPHTSSAPYHNYSLRDLNFSPNGKYIDFTKWGFETSEQIIVETQTGRSFLENSEIKDAWECWIEPEVSYKNILWTSGGEALVILEALQEAGDSSLKDDYTCIWVSDYGNPESLNLIYSIPEDEKWERIEEAYLVDDKVLYFKEGRSKEEFKYDISRGKFVFVLSR